MLHTYDDFVPTYMSIMFTWRRVEFAMLVEWMALQAHGEVESEGEVDIEDITLTELWR